MLCLGAAAGCGRSTIRAHETHYCSIVDEDPLFVCSPQFDLVCINTYFKRVEDQNLAKQFDGGLRPIYVCRLVCNPDGSIGCNQPGDICCRGNTHGKNYGSTHACVPASLCETMPVILPDAASGQFPDSQQFPDRASDTAAADAGVADVPQPSPTDGGAGG
jgi:hypothetical protein